jgi:hypothetical protein
MDIFNTLNASKYEAQEDTEENFINLDDLYNRQHNLKLARESNYNKILKRIHNKIKMTSRMFIDQYHTFFIIPEIMLGVPRYNVQHCLAYVTNKLTDNGFYVQYIHPNTIFISWQHYLPQYKREMIREVHGVNVDSNGNVLPDKPKTNTNDDDDPMMLGSSIQERNELIKQQEKEKKKVQFNDINEYKPSGIYDKDILLSLNKKFT